MEDASADCQGPSTNQDPRALPFVRKESSSVSLKKRNWNGNGSLRNGNGSLRNGNGSLRNGNGTTRGAKLEERVNALFISHTGGNAKDPREDHPARWWKTHGELIKAMDRLIVVAMGLELTEVEKALTPSYKDVTESMARAVIHALVSLIGSDRVLGLKTRAHGNCESCGVGPRPVSSGGGGP